MEEELDEIEEGRLNFVDALKEFHKQFAKDLKAATANMENIKKMEEPTDRTCEKCGKPMVIKWGRYGRFIACSGYPECKNTQEIATVVNGSGGNGQRPAAPGGANAAEAPAIPEGHCTCGKGGSAVGPR